MKTFLLLIFLAGAAEAQIYFKSVPMCTSWNFASGGYVCSSYPSSQSIPDQFSLNNKIMNLENRIQALELKISHFEQIIEKGQ